MPMIEDLAPLDTDDRLAIVHYLHDYSQQLGFPWAIQPIHLALRDDQGKIIGGLLGVFHWQWLRIKILAVAPEYRGKGWGRRLMAEAERRAIEKGCEQAWVDTFSFQAPDFYRQLGYVLFGELVDYPSGQNRLFFRKVLVEPGARPRGVQERGVQTGSDHRGSESIK
ncbi:MAG: GNAT family N-acetyltransferase [Gemmataceae bacterium]